jgi:hypothetical protein
VATTVTGLQSGVFFGEMLFTAALLTPETTLENYRIQQTRSVPRLGCWNASRPRSDTVLTLVFMHFEHLFCTCNKYIFHQSNSFAFEWRWNIILAKIYLLKRFTEAFSELCWLDFSHLY